MSTEGPPLYVAAGGGGDVLGALMVALSEGTDPARTHIATFAWERKRFDPRPGPRAAEDFLNLLAPAEGVCQLAEDSRLRRGRSFLPDLVREVGCQVYLLDPTFGVNGLRRQIALLGDYLDTSQTLVVDVGGDILARGREPGLRSPTADAMALAAAEASGRETWIIALGLGLDGELSRSQWRAACRAGAVHEDSRGEVARVEVDAATFVRRLLSWHPSEVAGLACLAALGYHGTAELRADGLQVQLDRDAATVHRFEPAWVMARNRVAQAICHTTSLSAVEDAVRRTVGHSELDDERRMLANRSRYSTDWLTPAELADVENELLSYSADAARRDVSFLTLRRISELLALSPRPFGQLCKHLARRYPQRIQPPVWCCESGPRRAWDAGRERPPRNE